MTNGELPRIPVELVCFSTFRIRIATPRAAAVNVILMNRNSYQAVSGNTGISTQRKRALPKGHRCYSIDTFSHAFLFSATSCHWDDNRRWAIDRRVCPHSAAFRKCSDETKTRTALQPTESPTLVSDFARACTEWRESRASLCAGYGLVRAATLMPVLDSSRRRVLRRGPPPLCG